VPLDSVNITVEPNTWTGDTMFTTPQTFFTGFDGTVNVYTYQTAAKTTYDDSLTSLSATNVQTAIQALNTKIDSM
jgi:hypothetical protein